ncbi:hypothetical protein TSAR_000759 [Trichomalopsis sarcophagae]|uniref:Uncharacterized protein n=1 Tax=Trichomalopsis sarcophagae TaxID=543379 RepID=A0A232FHN9_9HYME|nr:hypothetical protein TSAR_000759 [Trichomalopsis sarcophagae]
MAAHLRLTYSVFMCVELIIAAAPRPIYATSFTWNAPIVSACKSVRLAERRAGKICIRNDDLQASHVQYSVPAEILLNHHCAHNRLIKSNEALYADGEAAAMTQFAGSTRQKADTRASDSREQNTH